MAKIDLTKLKNIQDVLRYTYGLLALAVGVDKYFNVFTDWVNYLNPAIPNFFNMGGQTFMYYVGVVEMLAGTLVLLMPKTGAYVVSLWLLGITVNLVSQGQYFDIAARDVVMAIGAFTLARLTGIIEEAEQVKVSTKTGVEELELVE